MISQWQVFGIGRDGVIVLHILWNCSACRQGKDAKVSSVTEQIFGLCKGTDLCATFDDEQMTVVLACGVLCCACAWVGAGGGRPLPQRGSGYYHRENLYILHKNSCIFVHIYMILVVTAILMHRNRRQWGKILGHSLFCPQLNYWGNMSPSVSAPVLHKNSCTFVHICMILVDIAILMHRHARQ